MNKNSSQPKRHHYVPEVYLKRFADSNEKMWIYDRLKKEYRYQVVKKIASQNHFYKFKTKDGGESLDLEKLLSKIEGNFSRVVDKVLKKEKLSLDERGQLAIFITFQILRTPEHKKHMEEMYEKGMRKISSLQFSDIGRNEKLIDELGFTEDITSEEVKNFFEKENYNISFPREFFIKHLLESYSRILPLIYGFDWFFVETEKNLNFIITDHPFFITRPEHLAPFRGVGLLTKDSEKTIPLTKKLCLIMGNLSSLEEGYVEYQSLTNKELIRRINLNLVRSSNRFIYSDDRDFLEFLIKRSKIDSVPVDRERVKVV